jgi:hypothetical protein
MSEDDEFFLSKALAVAKTFKWFAPVNQKEQRDKFFTSNTYEPQFTYRKLPTKSIKLLERKLKSLKTNGGNDLTSYITKRRLIEAKLKLKLISSVGNAKSITLLSEKLYGLKFKRSYLKQALEDAAIVPDLKQVENLSASKTRAIIRKYLKERSINLWRVITTSKNDFYIQVRFKKNLISISKDINWDFADIDSILAHEIDGHVIRAVNSLNHPNPLMRSYFPFYIKTEEGLACYLGDYCSPNGSLSLKQHAIKYLAGYFALNNSFRQTYNLLLDFGYTKELAFQRTLRLKKGLTDTSLPGCNAREAMYYEGMLEVKDYLKSGGSLKKLFSAKIGLEDVNFIAAHKRVIVPDRIINQNINIS